MVCGRLDDDRGRISYTYARSYLARPEAVPVYEPELAIRPGALFSADGNRLPLCIDDAMPDSWGRRLVGHRLDAPTGEFGELTYLLESGSDRIGALDFQKSPTEYLAREVDRPTVDDLATASERIEAGLDLNPVLEAALLRGTSIGGARPKALLDDGNRKLVAKFSSTTDTYPVVQGEFVAMELAQRVGIDVAAVELTRAAGRYALLIERFDRDLHDHRQRVVSALTVLGLSAFPGGRYASYADLADQVRARFVNADATLRELFARVSVNILCGNTDDHGRNHAAFVRSDGLALAPAYDVCPQGRSGTAAAQAMAFGRDGQRDARLSVLVDAASVFHLDRAAAEAIAQLQVDAINDNWDTVCDLAQLTAAERAAFMGRQFLNPYAFDA